MLATRFENCLENTISIIIILIFQSAINYILIDHQGCVLGMYKKTIFYNIINCFLNMNFWDFYL